MVRELKEPKDDWPLISQGLIERLQRALPSLDARATPATSDRELMFQAGQLETLRLLKRIHRHQMRRTQSPTGQVDAINVYS